MNQKQTEVGVQIKILLLSPDSILNVHSEHNKKLRCWRRCPIRLVWNSRLDPHRWRITPALVGGRFGTPVGLTPNIIKTLIYKIGITLENLAAHFHEPSFTLTAIFLPGGEAFPALIKHKMLILSRSVVDGLKWTLSNKLA